MLLIRTLFITFCLTNTYAIAQNPVRANCNGQPGYKQPKPAGTTHLAADCPEFDYQKNIDNQMDLVSLRAELKRIANEISSCRDDSDCELVNFSFTPTGCLQDFVAYSMAVDRENNFVYKKGDLFQSYNSVWFASRFYNYNTRVQNGERDPASDEVCRERPPIVRAACIEKKCQVSNK